MFTQHKVWCPDAGLFTRLVVLRLLDFKKKPPHSPVWAPHPPKVLTNFSWVFRIVVWEYPRVFHELVLLESCEGWRPQPHPLLTQPKKVLFLLHQFHLHLMMIIGLITIIRPSISTTSPTHILYQLNILALACVEFEGHCQPPLAHATLTTATNSCHSSFHSVTWRWENIFCQVWYVCSVQYVCLYVCICAPLCLYLFSCPMVCSSYWCLSGSFQSCCAFVYCTSDILILGTWPSRTKTSRMINCFPTGTC